MAWRFCKSRSRPARSEKRCARRWTAAWRRPKVDCRYISFLLGQRWLWVWAFGSSRRIGGAFGLGDCGDALYVEFSIVGVARYFIDFERFHQKDTHSNVSFFISGQPDFIVNVSLLENKTGALLQVGDHPAAEAEISHKISFQTRNVAGFLIDPDDAGEFVHYFLG